MSLSAMDDKRDRVVEFYDRALVGELVGERQFDTRILPAKLRELVGKYEIVMTPGEFVPMDLDMARRVLEAGVELLADLGVYCTDTERLIAISRDEIETALEESPESFQQGCGAQTVKVRARGLDDTRAPSVNNGSCGSPMSEEAVVPALASCAMEDIDGLVTGYLKSVLGRQTRARTPIELLACKKEVIYARQSLEIAGKPGLSILGIMSGGNSESQDACTFEGGLRASDRHLNVFDNELKLSFDTLNRVLHDAYAGTGTVSAIAPMLGGYCGGPESTAICGVAEVLASRVIFDNQCMGSWVESIWQDYASPQWLWVAGMLSLAFVAAGQHLVTGNWLGGNAGPWTAVQCREMAAQSVAVIACGSSIVHGFNGNAGTVEDHVTGMESRMLVEVSRVAAGMSVTDANDIVGRVLAGYEDLCRPGNAPFGKSFFECYDADSLQPKEEFVAFWEAEKADLRSCGLPL